MDAFNATVTCTYVATWVAIKTGWRLSIDRDEHDALVDIATGCESVQVDIRPV